MANEEFKIYVDQLRLGGTEKLSESLAPDFLQVQEAELVFPEPIAIQGEAYVAIDSLIIRLNAATFAYMPCALCNERVAVGIKLKDFYHSEPLEEIKTGIFNFSEMLREAILLEVPQFVECNEGKCPQRKELSQFLKKVDPQRGKVKDEEEGYQPFADLDIEEINKPKSRKKT